jgi:hypothetical protein
LKGRRNTHWFALRKFLHPTVGQVALFEVADDGGNGLVNHRHRVRDFRFEGTIVPIFYLKYAVSSEIIRKKMTHGEVETFCEVPFQLGRRLLEDQVGVAQVREDGQEIGVLERFEVADLIFVPDVSLDGDAEGHRAMDRQVEIEREWNKLKRDSVETKRKYIKIAPI